MNKPSWSALGRTGKIYKHKDLTWFACEGLIALHDARDAEWIVLRTTELAERQKALREFAGKLEPSDKPWQKQEGRAMLAAAKDMLAAIKEAKYMGDPNDPAVQAFWSRHRNRKSTVSLSAGSDQAGYPELPDVALGPRTGRTAAVDKQAAVVADDVHLRVHRPPRRKHRAGIVLPDST